MLDLVISGARVIDGTGAPWSQVAIGLQDGRIATLTTDGAPPSLARIDATGLWLAPGWIDAHTHDDLALRHDPTLGTKTLQGVTTIVTGNCSFGTFPLGPDSAMLLRDHLASLLGRAGEDDVFADYRAYGSDLSRRGIGPNAVCLVGHAPLRLAVMGQAARSATEAEITAMEALLDHQLAQGAAGLSLGLVYAPGLWATSDELLRLARVTARHGRVLAAHIRSYDTEIDAAIGEYLGLLQATGARGVLSHLQVCGTANWGRMPALLDRLEQARQDGLDVACDMYPYTAGSSTILQILPPDALAGGVETAISLLADPVTRANLRAKVEGHVPQPGWAAKVGQIGWHNLRVAAVEDESLRHYEGRTLAQIGEDEDRPPFDVAADLVCCDAGRTSMVMFQQDQSDLDHVLAHRLHMVGSDSLPRPTGKPHPRAAGTFARIIDAALRRDGGRTLEETVRKMTSLPAQRFGLWDRGIIRPGMAADIVLFSSDTRDRATYDDPRLPPAGVHTVIVNGKPVVADGRMTGQRPGRLLASPSLHSPAAWPEPEVLP